MPSGLELDDLRQIILDLMGEHPSQELEDDDLFSARLGGVTYGASKGSPQHRKNYSRDADRGDPLRQLLGALVQPSAETPRGEWPPLREALDGLRSEVGDNESILQRMREYEGFHRRRPGRY